MKPNAGKPAPALSGVTGTARVGRATSAVLPLLQPGDIAVIDQADLDRDAATALVEAGVAAVVNAASMVAGRYANLGPEVLAGAGVVVVDQVGQAALDRIEDDQCIRVHDGVVYAVGPDGQNDVITHGRRVDLDGSHGRGLPKLTTELAGRAVVVVGAPEHGELKAVAPFVRERAPVVIAVGVAADDLLGVSWVPDIVIVTAGDPGSIPSTDALRVAADVVLVTSPGTGLQEQATLEAVAGPPRIVETSATAEDVALLLADRYDASLVVAVGLRARPEKLLDRPDDDPDSGLATWLRLGERLVDAEVVRALSTGRPFRHHVASLVAVFLALAVGIVLGGGPLSHGDEGDSGGAPATSSAKEPALPSDRNAEFADAFADVGADRLYAGGLTGHATAVLALPGAETSQIKAVQAQVVKAGGAITGTFDLSSKLLDASQRLLVDSTSTQLASRLADPRIDAATPAYERMGQLIGLAMATTQPSSVRADPAAVSVRESLSEAQLLSSPRDVRNAPLVLVVLPPGANGPESSLAARTMLSGLVSGIAKNAAGVVVVGDEDSAADGDLAALREAELTGAVSTVDGIETTIGQVTAVLAMVGVFAGTTGAYGASGSDGVVPLP